MGGPAILAQKPKNKWENVEIGGMNLNVNNPEFDIVTDLPGIGEDMQAPASYLQTDSDETSQLLLQAKNQ